MCSCLKGFKFSTNMLLKAEAAQAYVSCYPGAQSSRCLVDGRHRAVLKPKRTALCAPPVPALVLSVLLADVDSSPLVLGS